MRFLLFNGFYFGKMWKDTAGLRKYCTGGYGQIGVHRVKGDMSDFMEKSENYISR